MHIIPNGMICVLSDWMLIVDELATHLYDFLPGSGNRNTGFPLAAERVGIEPLWQGGSKQPAIVALIAATLERQSNKITDLMQEIVRQSITWCRNNQLAVMLEQKINAMLLEQKEPIRQYLYPEIAAETGLPLETVRGLCFSIDCGHNGFTVLRGLLT